MKQLKKSVAVRRGNDVFLGTPLEIKLIGPKNLIARDVIAIQDRFAGSRVCPIRFGGKILGNISIDEALLYPLPATATLAAAPTAIP